MERLKPTGDLCWRDAESPASGGGGEDVFNLKAHAAAVRAGKFVHRNQRRFVSSFTQHDLAVPNDHGSETGSAVLLNHGMIGIAGEERHTASRQPSHLCHQWVGGIEDGHAGWQHDIHWRPLHLEHVLG